MPRFESLAGLALCREQLTPDKHARNAEQSAGVEAFRLKESMLFMRKSHITVPFVFLLAKPGYPRWATQT